MAERTIHLVFKTHLDIGFTDLAGKVRRQYHERFIPQALDTAEHFFAEDPAQKIFVWTTGAWLVWDHLDSQPKEKVKRLERAIERGLIRWHALPFTTHSELMSPALFRAGLSFSRELDERFGVTTTAAKMTDVPGHTRGIVPLLAEADVRFLHIGVNSASTPPDIPPVFRWRAPGGEEIVVVYQNSYGATYFPDGFDAGLSFAHTMDNVGPQNVSQAAECHRDVRNANPGCEVEASTLEAYGALLWAERERFPVVDLELADSWIHGSASDPHKTARFLALQRLYDRFAQEGLDARRLAFGRGLTLVAEHTCGVDIKTYLRDESAWDRPAFAALRKSDFRFAYTESSWAEQRAYLDAADSELAGDDRAAAETALKELELFEAPADGRGDVNGSEVEVGNWRIAFDRQSGALTRLISPGGVAITGQDDNLVAYAYESYDAADIARHMKSYLTNWDEWAVLDHDKPGLKGARTACSAVFATTLAGVSRHGSFPVLRLAVAERARDQLGAPREIDLMLKPAADNALMLVLATRDKPANRMPEAGFLSVRPVGAGDWSYLKMGLWQPGDAVVRNGGGQLQAVAGLRCTLTDGQILSVTPLDTPLAAPAVAPFMPFSADPPDLSQGIRFNLHNNKWGTNFPMWWEGSFQARFVLKVVSQ